MYTPRSEISSASAQSEHIRYWRSEHWRSCVQVRTGPLGIRDDTFISANGRQWIVFNSTQPCESGQMPDTVQACLATHGMCKFSRCEGHRRPA